jgi:FtsZ-binding cell division protein ZapB
LTTTETEALKRTIEMLNERDEDRIREAAAREDRIRLLRAELDKSDKKIKGLEKEREELIKERDSLANDCDGLRFEANTWKKRYMQKTGVTLPGEAPAESATPEAPAVAGAPKAKAKRDRKPRSNV